MKDYDYVILWLDYFNKNLSRNKGRKINKEYAIFDPTMSDLLEAAKAAGFNPQSDNINDGARYPRRAYVRSGYIALPKQGGLKKNTLIAKIAEKMLKNKTKRLK